MLVGSKCSQNVTTGKMPKRQSWLAEALKTRNGQNVKRIKLETSRLERETSKRGGAGLELRLGLGLNFRLGLGLGLREWR